MKNTIRKIVFTLFICFSFFNFSAKTKSNNSKRGIDSLLIIRKTVKTDDAKLDVYQELAWMYRHVSTKIAKLYSDSTIIFADKLRKPNIKWYGLNSKAEALRLEGNLVEALNLHQQALLLAEADKLRIKVAHSCNNIGIVLREQKNQGGAVEYTEKARKIYTELNDTNGVITVCIN
ncbi:MAG TPA: tetratricopeptide repeat protein, partial [Bacteroidia bacterium]|nr:tetratricopeptide repeat protein [Bacteroidia bacterium]